ncbi:MAG: 50S ribosomal protein L25 [Candidatus Shapirobacteria bacterium]|nr:50S ribosomal protein L25 [Candidatus Shapirobacteria bacterium]
MKDKLQLNGTIRTVLGRKVKKLRREGFLPATVYGRDFSPLSVQFTAKELESVFDEVGESGLIELMLDDKKIPILFRNPQFHAIYGNLLHVDCFKVNLKEKITAMIPIEFIGESFAVKEGNVLVEAANEVEVEALPTDLPESIIVDISKLENLESQITVADLDVDRTKVEILNDATQVIIKVEEPRVEEEPIVAEEVTPGEVPATAQKTEEELAAKEAAEKEDK